MEYRSHALLTQAACCDGEAAGVGAGADNVEEVAEEAAPSSAVGKDSPMPQEAQKVHFHPHLLQAYTPFFFRSSTRRVFSCWAVATSSDTPYKDAARVDRVAEDDDADDDDDLDSFFADDKFSKTTKALRDAKV